MVEAAQRAGVEHFVFFSALGASEHHRARLFRAKAIAEQAVRESDMRSTVIAPSLVYAPGDRWLTLIERLALLPVVPVSGRGRARLPADLGRGRRGLRDGRRCARDARAAAALTSASTSATSSRARRPSPTSEVVRTVLRSLDRERPLLPIPTPIASRALRRSSA